MGGEGDLGAHFLSLEKWEKMKRIDFIFPKLVLNSPLSWLGGGGDILTFNVLIFTSTAPDY
jgi:hypothetical protein